MLTLFPFLQSSTVSYRINCEIQYPMFKWLDENNEKTTWVRLQATGVLIASNVAAFATRISKVVESFFRGLKTLACTPLCEKKMENVKLGLCEIFILTPKNVLKVLFIPVELVVDGCVVCVEPRFYIYHASETMKVNLKHANKNTIRSLEHINDSSEASAIAYKRLLDSQKASNKI